MEDRSKRRVAFEKRAKRMLRYLEDSTGFSIMQLAQQARNEKGAGLERFVKA